LRRFGTAFCQYHNIGSRVLYFEALSRGLYTRCLRFAPPVARTGRKTRFRLLARLCRVGLYPLGSFSSLSRPPPANDSKRPDFAWRTSGKLARETRASSPQIRTCGTTASGSSVIDIHQMTENPSQTHCWTTHGSHEVSSASHRDSVDTSLSSCALIVFPLSDRPSPATASLQRVFVGRIPRLHRYYQPLRRLPLIRTRFGLPSRARTTVCAVSSLRPRQRNEPIR
jgi:hypothetical protein